ncbi:MAG: hypothetical protein J6Y94_08080 [Bacteriovoracaceae bacterium]|nr:hypothetical protein [Bacteriovoracaceae bacterium]
MNLGRLLMAYAPQRWHTLIIILACLCGMTYPLLSKADVLVFIKTVSTSKRSFVINRGRLDEVRIQQKRAFSSDQASVVARAIEVGPQTSLWEVEDPHLTVPFKKGELVSLSTQTQSLWANILTVEQHEQDLVKAKKLAALQQTDWLVRGAYMYNFSATTSQVAAQEKGVRQGGQLEVLYHSWFKLRPLALRYGLRFDQEQEVISAVNVTIQTWRMLLTGEVVWHFNLGQEHPQDYYVAAGMALGFSNSQLKDLASKFGPTAVFPHLHFGHSRLIRERFHLDFDIAIENIIALETFTAGIKQKSNFLNAKFGLGIRF